MALRDILPAARQLPRRDKLRLIRILAEELDTSDEAEDISPLEPHKVYYLPTPYGATGAGKALMEAMRASEEG